MRDFWEEYSVFIIPVVVMVMIFAMIFGCAISMSLITTYHACQDLAAYSPELDYRWSFWTGCFIRLPSGVFVPYDDYKALEFIK